MKKIFKFLFVAILASVTLISCDESSEDIVYDNINGQTLAQFSKTDMALPTPSEGVTIQVEVLVSTISTSDRTFQIAINDDTTATSDQYTIEGNLIIPANSYAGYINISGNYNEIQEEGSSYIVLDLIQIDGDSNTIFEDSTVTIEVFRKCPIMAGTYTLELADSWGDGWQGSKITVSIDGVESTFALPDWNQGQPGPWAADTFTFDVPENTETLTFTWSSGSYPEETTFVIKSPSGNVLTTGGPSHANGNIKYNPCNS